MIKFGVAGYPPAFGKSIYGKDRLKIFNWLRDLGLDAFEAQMTYGPRTKPEVCLEMKKAAEDLGIKISVHAAYYIVMTSKEKGKLRASADTLKKTYELADIMGADTIVLHPGPLYGEKEAEVKSRFIENMTDFFKTFSHDKIGLFLETAGKKGQLGSTEDIIEFSQKIKGCFPCFDFGHIHARTAGTLDDVKAIHDLIGLMEREKIFKSRYHFHYTPIDYGPKGEIAHKAIEDFYPQNMQNDLFSSGENRKPYHPRFEAIIEKLKSINADCTIISETHDSQERGALAMKRHYREFSCFCNPYFPGSRNILYQAL